MKPIYTKSQVHPKMGGELRHTSVPQPIRGQFPFQIPAQKPRL